MTNLQKIVETQKSEIKKLETTIQEAESEKRNQRKELEGVSSGTWEGEYLLLETRIDTYATYGILLLSFFEFDRFLLSPRIWNRLKNCPLTKCFK